MNDRHPSSLRWAATLPARTAMGAMPWLTGLLLLLSGCVAAFNHPLPARGSAPIFEDGYWRVNSVSDNAGSLVFIRAVEPGLYSVSFFADDRMRSVRVRTSTIGENQYLSVDLSRYAEFWLASGQISRPVKSRRFVAARVAPVAGGFDLYPMADHVLKTDVVSGRLQGATSEGCEPEPPQPLTAPTTARETGDPGVTWPFCQIRIDGSDDLSRYLADNWRRVFPTRKYRMTNINLDRLMIDPPGAQAGD